ncbi:hypothetical protein E0H26_21205 [Micromonospora zingiberis]|uniref:Uncharacterized protein n=1 Tax=Micromonospora zingiberis TaxID=2053011 RepID=A0A4R0GE78_9ACTN|nr:GIY-YIG nuclease family protein [Micromonospora zingiberis]TCB94443.1 hypothetical protein E0H26_21205 [Micromonospora zingiberis]
MSAAHGLGGDERTVLSGRTSPPEFSMRSSWTRDTRLSLAAVGFLARLSERLKQAEVVRLSELDDDSEQRQDVIAELAAAGYLVNGKLLDPFEAQWCVDQEKRTNMGYARRVPVSPLSLLPDFESPPPEETGLWWPAPAIQTEELAAEADEEMVRERGSVVYFMEFRDYPVVKIGFTANLPARLKSVAKAFGVTPDMDIFVTATEPGGKATEQLRHWQLMAARLPCIEVDGGSELFYSEHPAVTDHIAYLWHVEWGCPEKYRRNPLRGMAVTV